ncbi:MAG TPA: hypothetical protein VK811_00990 [Candidatus Acidoferrum sp.]|jgi:hypothetical protein|nr:hypothetical protein [Candidatus Acidoferrum sp.]
MIGQKTFLSCIVSPSDSGAGHLSHSPYWSHAAASSPFPPVQKSALIRIKESKIPKPSRVSPRLAKPAQGTSLGRGEGPISEANRFISCSSLANPERLWALISALLDLGKFSPIKVILGYFRLFPEKKDCFIFMKTLGVSNPRHRRFQTLPARAGRKPTDSSLCKVKNFLGYPILEAIRASPKKGMALNES